jgi:hypothetical protein
VLSSHSGKEMIIVRTDCNDRKEGQRLSFYLVPLVMHVILPSPEFRKGP